MRSVLTGFLCLVAIAAGAYIALCALLFFGQERFIFFPVRTDPSLALEWQARRVEIPSGETIIEGWWAEHPAEEGSVVVLYFGGNAEEVLYTLTTADRLHARRVLATNYRGYGGSGGRPSQAAIFADALAVYDYVAGQPDIAPENIVVMGRSLGSAVATYLAARRPVRAAVLVTPFDSILAAAQRHYPFFPVRWLLKHPFPAVQFAREARSPAVLLAGERDRIVPPVHAERLFDAWAGDKDFHILTDVGHNDIELHPEYYPLINEFLRSLPAGDRRR